MASSNHPIISGYVVCEKIGSGSYGEVYKAYKKDAKKEVVAIKCVTLSKLSKTAQDNIISEIGILKKLNHENIVMLKDFSWDATHIYLIMEFCSGGNLWSYIRHRHRLNESTCRHFLQQLVHALSYLRQKNISHFDLKPQNIFLASRNLQVLKIGDFGLAQYISEDENNCTIKGSPLYMAPEIIIKGTYDSKADIWSVGIILYECLFGKAPYSSKTFDELISKIKDNAPIEIPSCASISSNCKHFLEGCLQRDPNKRFDFQEFFNHPFVDLEHAPNSESILKASNLIAKALDEERASKMKEAFEKYNEALKYLIPSMLIERDANKRASLRKKIKSYICRMEELKNETKNNIAKDAEIHEIPSNSSSSLTDSTISPQSLRELFDLSKTTPTMTTAIEIAQSGELYEKENNYTLALEKYEMALGKLLSLIQNEPKGRRRDLLLEVSNKWMERAELVKSFNQMESQIEADVSVNEKTCSLQ